MYRLHLLLLACVGGGHWFFGSHRIETRWHELWLMFDGAGLRAVSWAAAVDTKHSRYSPRHDLCTGELSFLVDVSWTYDLVGSTDFLDDVMIAHSSEPCPPPELSTASRVLRVDTPDGASIVYPFDLTPEDPGFLLLYVSLEEVCLYPPSTRPIDRSSRCRPA